MNRQLNLIGYKMKYSLNFKYKGSRNYLTGADIFNEVNKCEIRYKYSERRNGDLSSVVANNELAIKLLDWEPYRDLKQMCIDGWKWRSMNLNGYD